MSGMAGMMGMGMDMTGAAMFQPVNMYISHLFWYLILAATTVGFLGHMLNKGNTWLRFATLSQMDAL